MIEQYATEVFSVVTSSLIVGTATWFISDRRAREQEREKWMDKVQELEAVLMTGGDHWVGDSVLDIIESHDKRLEKQQEVKEEHERRLEELEEVASQHDERIAEVHERINNLREKNGLDPV